MFTFFVRPSVRASALNVFCLLAGILSLAFLILAAPTATPVSAQTLAPSRVEPVFPNSLGLLSFEAQLKKETVLLKWETGTEMTIVGFNVWRRRGHHEPKCLNEGMIPSLSPGMVTGNTYSLRDRDVSVGKTYFYRLEVVTADGYSAWTDEVKIRVK